MWQVGLLMETVKVYCSSDEKERIKKIAAASGLKASKYLLQQGLREGLGDLPERAMLAQLVSCMVRPMSSQTVRATLLAIAQEVLEGSSILEARARIVEVCKDADQGSQGQ